MYQVPSDETILKCIVTKEAAEGTERPNLLVSDGSQKKYGSSRRMAEKNDEIA